MSTNTTKPVRWIALRDTNLARQHPEIVQCDGAGLGTPCADNPLYKEVPIGDANSPEAAAKLVAKARAADPAWNTSERDHWIRWGDQVYDRYGRDSAGPYLPTSDKRSTGGDRLARFHKMTDERREKALRLIADPDQPHNHLPPGLLLYGHQAKTLSDATDITAVCEALMETDKALCPSVLHSRVDALVSARRNTLETGALLRQGLLAYQGNKPRAELGLDFFTEKELADALVNLENHDRGTDDRDKDPTGIARAGRWLRDAHNRTVPDGTVVVWSDALSVDPDKHDWGAPASGLMAEGNDLVRHLNVPVALLYGFVSSDDGAFKRQARLFEPPGQIDPEAPRDVGSPKVYTDELAAQAITLPPRWFDCGLEPDEHNAHPGLETGHNGGRTPEAKTKRFKQALIDRDANYFHELCITKAIQAKRIADLQAEIDKLTDQSEHIAETAVGHIAYSRAQTRIKSSVLQMQHGPPRRRNRQLGANTR